MSRIAIATTEISHHVVKFLALGGKRALVDHMLGHLHAFFLGVGLLAENCFVICRVAQT